MAYHSYTAILNRRSSSCIHSITVLLDYSLKGDIMENLSVYEKVKNMSLEEMKKFIYWVYTNGVNAGKANLYDDKSGFFGGRVLEYDANIIFPDGTVESLT